MIYHHLQQQKKKFNQLTVKLHNKSSKKKNSLLIGPRTVLLIIKLRIQMINLRKLKFVLNKTQNQIVKAISTKRMKKIKSNNNFSRK